MSKFELHDKVTIVTGGAGGIGTCIAMEYASAGANVVVASRKLEPLEKVAGDIKSQGGESMAVAVDITKPDEVDNMVTQTVDRFGALDIIVNYAVMGGSPRCLQKSER